MITTLTSILIALGLLLGSTGATVYAAQDSLPGDSLYMVKIYGEDLQFNWTNSEDAKLDLALRFAARRVGEALALAENGEQIQENHAYTFEKYLEAALSAAAEVDDTVQALEQIKDAVQRHIRDCDRAQGNLPEDKDFGLNMFRHAFQNQLKITGEALDDPLAFKHAFQNRFRGEQEVLEDASGDDPVLEEEPVDDELVDDDPTEEEDTTQGPGYGGQKEADEVRGENGEQTQTSEVKGEAYGPGEPQAQPDEPYGPNDGTGYGPGEQQSNKPDNGSGGGSDSGSGGNPGSGSDGGSGGDTGSGSGGKP